MPPGTPRTSPCTFALALLLGLSVCAIAASTMVPALLGSLGGWPLLSAGVLGLVGALAALCVIYGRRDRTLR